MQHYRLPRRLADRETFILDRCRGRTVLHLGCADSPYTAERLATGGLLHTRIRAVAASIVGIDLDADGVAMLHAAGYPECVTGDAEALDPALPTFEVIVAGEIIEHLNNAGGFLASCRAHLADSGILLITTVNAFRLAALLRVSLGTESVHPDHVYYFSHRTLEELCRRFGLEPELRMNYRVPGTRPRIPYVIDRLAGWMSPTVTSGLIHVYRRV